MQSHEEPRPVVPGRKARSARRTFASAVLVSQVIVIFFTGVVAVRLELAPANQTWIVTGVLLALALLAVASLRSGYGYGYGIGAVLQLAVIATGLVVPIMWFLGAVYLALWLMAFTAGGRIDRERAAHAATAEIA